MPTSSTTETTPATELASVHDIAARYGLPGPHATVVLRVPTPGIVGDDLSVRWSSIETQLHHLGASALAINHLSGLLASASRRGRPLLLTANDESAASCWLTLDLEPSISVGALPALVPAFHQADLASASTIAAAVDRTGADLYRVGPFDIEIVSTVRGEEEHIHKAASGGWSQARHQRHSEVVWERNASLIASTIADEVDLQAADSIILTGDDREVNLVVAQLADGHVARVDKRAAGGRHEPGTTDRLREAAIALRADKRQERVALALDQLREELGQQDRAVAGSIEVLEAITDNRVKTLFVDLSTGRGLPHVDATVRAALAHGADVVTGYDFDVHDGIAAVLRMPYH